MFKNKLSLIISSIVILLPCILGIVKHNLTFVIAPVILLALQWLCIFITYKDPRNKGQSKKLMGFVIWIVPIISVFVSTFILYVDSAYSFSPTMPVIVILSTMFIFVGNYLPKCKRNSTLGIKIKRTLESDSNWYATHRFAGKLWVACGILMMFTIFLNYTFFAVAMTSILFIAVIPPIIYSHLFYKKEVANGTYSPDRTDLLFNSKKAKGITIVLVTVILSVCCCLMFTGNIEIFVDENKITLEATYWDDTVIDLSEIESIEYSEKGVDAVRISGFASSKLLLGTFQNDELGRHTSYRYTKCDSVIILKTKNTTYVFNAETPEKTKDIYDSIVK